LVGRSQRHRPITQIWNSGTLIKHAYMLAGGLAFGAVFVIITLVFRSLRDAMVTLVPVAVGFAVTFGVMWLCGMSINMANIIVLPL